MPFPLGKLLSLAVRQAAKPVADYMQRRAQTNETFRSLCIRAATIYHTLEYRVIQNFYERRAFRHVPVPELDPSRAVLLGTRLFGEGIIFSIAALLFVAEYQRGVMKEAAKEKQLASRLNDLEDKVSVALAQIHAILKQSEEPVDVVSGPSGAPTPRPLKPSVRTQPTTT